MTEPSRPPIRLGKLERNAIYNAIAQSGLDLSECQFSITGDTAIIAHDSGSTLRFELVVDPGLASYVGTAAVVDGSTEVFRTASFVDDKLLGKIQSWAHEIKQVVEAPDLWLEMQHSRQLISACNALTPTTHHSRKSSRGK
jgi:hypothetical protein